MDTGIELIEAERRRQIEQEGWSAEHDDKHSRNQLQHAAACYLESAKEPNLPADYIPMLWPWERNSWKPGTPKRMLEKAGALYLAEIDRLRRLLGKQQIGNPGIAMAVLARRVDESAQLIDEILFQEEA